jgi:alpha-1,2-mannosyltransferase
MPPTQAAERREESVRETLTRRWSRPLALGVALAGLVVVVVALLLWADRSRGWAYDFNAYYYAGVRFAQTGSPYLAESLSGPFELSPGGHDRPAPFGLYLYPPPLAILFGAVVPLGERLATFGWLALNIGLFGLTCALLPVSRPVRLAVFGVTALGAPLLFELNLGNVSVLVTFALTVAWRWLDRPVAGVAMAAVMAVRPTMALMVGWWIVRGQWRPSLWAVIAGLAIILGSLTVAPLAVWLEYATVLGNLRGVTGALRNADPGSAVLLLGGQAWLAPVALFTGYAVAVVAILLSLRRDPELSFMVTASATLLLSPVLWDHYLIQLLLPAAFLASRGRYWGLGLPLLGWLPLPLLPLAAMAGMLLPFLAGAPAGRPRHEAKAVPAAGLPDVAAARSGVTETD